RLIPGGLHKTSRRIDLTRRALIASILSTAKEEEKRKGQSPAEGSVKYSACTQPMRGVMRSGANLSFIVDGDDVAFPALKLDDADARLSRLITCPGPSRWLCDVPWAVWAVRSLGPRSYNLPLCRLRKHPRDLPIGPRDGSVVSSLIA